MIKLKTKSTSVTFIITVLLFVIGSSINTMADENTEYLVKLKKNINVLNLCGNTDVEELIPEIGLYMINDISNVNLSEVEYIEENTSVKLFDTYDYSTVLQQSEFPLTEISSIWDIGVYGSDITIGIIDSGCSQHKGIIGNLKGGYNFINNSEDYSDNIGHGTAVSGVAGAVYGQRKVIGTAHKSNIIALKFMDKNDSGILGGSLEQMIKAIKGGVDLYNCDILNISSGVENESQALKDAIDYAVDKGVIIVAAVGNDGDSRYNYPAAYNNVIGVGSVTSSKTHSDFSNNNDSVFITAPGNKINILRGTSATTTGNGTSYSAPYVSGIIADMKEIKPDITLSETMKVLSVTAEDLGDIGKDNLYGYGLINANKIVNYLLANTDYYISNPDVCSEDSLYEIRIKCGNNSNVPVGIWAEYSGEILKGVSTKITPLGDDIYMIRYQKSGSNDLRYFIWESFENMKPIKGGQVK